jgi:hypothetical protein
MHRLRAAAAVAALAFGAACAGDGGNRGSDAATSDMSVQPGEPSRARMQMGAGEGPRKLSRGPVDEGGGARDQRIAIWYADVLLEVDDVAEAAKALEALAKESGGFAEDTTLSDEKAGSVRIRVPSAGLDATLDALDRIGREKERSVSNADVTETYLDLETRLKSARELRDKLRALLAQAKTVKDLLAVETELNRVQTEIESMDGQLTRLKGQVDLATVTVRLERRRILGPLGYVAKGIAWAVGKLFVIR